MSDNLVLTNVEHVVFAEAFLFGTRNNPDDVPFAACQDLTHKHPVQVRELAGPEGRTAIAVGIAGEAVTLTSKYAVVDPLQVMLARDITPTKISAVDDPADAPTLSDANAGTLAAGYYAVAFAYRTPYGHTAISPVATINLTADKNITVAALTPLPAGVDSVDLYCSATFAASADAAAVLPLYFVTNYDGSAHDIATLPTAKAAPAPTFSTVRTDMTSLVVTANDKVKAFDIKMEGTKDGSNFKRIYKNCVLTESGDTVNGPREFMIGDITINCYGRKNPATGNIELYETLYSGDRT